MKYELKGTNINVFFVKDGHTMFNTDVLEDLRRLAYLESLVTKIGGTHKLLEIANMNTKGTER